MTEILQRADAAHAEEIAMLRLETHVHQDAALRLYRTAGCREIDPFGEYRPDPLSALVEKRLLPAEAG